MIGVGEGPWDTCREFDTRLSGRYVPFDVGGGGRGAGVGREWGRRGGEVVLIFMHGRSILTIVR